MERHFQIRNFTRNLNQFPQLWKNIYSKNRNHPQNARAPERTTHHLMLPDLKSPWLAWEGEGMSSFPWESVFPQLMTLSLSQSPPNPLPALEIWEQSHRVSLWGSACGQVISSQPKPPLREGAWGGEAWEEKQTSALGQQGGWPGAQSVGTSLESAPTQPALPQCTRCLVLIRMGLAALRCVTGIDGKRVYSRRL